MARAAARHSRVAHEAEDLVQDVLMAAIERGRDCTAPDFLPWALGAIRNRASFAARTAARRKLREASIMMPDDDSPALPKLPATFLAALPPAQRILALLVNLGMDRLEIAYLLGLSDVALRQRLAGLRRALSQFGVAVETLDPRPESHGDGIARRALKRDLRVGTARAFAIRDPDGIPIFFSRRDHV